MTCSSCAAKRRASAWRVQSARRVVRGRPPGPRLRLARGDPAVVARVELLTQPAAWLLREALSPRSVFSESEGRIKNPKQEHPRGAMHCEWVVLVVLVRFDEPVTGPPT